MMIGVPAEDSRLCKRPHTEAEHEEESCMPKDVYALPLSALGDSWFCDLP